MGRPAFRLPDVETGGDLPVGFDFDDDKIRYWKTPNEWWFYFPGCGVGRLTKHKVVENEDKTITVTPSIRMSKPKSGDCCHGFLTNGEWRDA